MSERKPCIALVSARIARNLDEDLPPLERALRDAGAEVRVADWDDPSVDWTVFDAAVLRSTWDYTTRLDEFLSWARHVAERTRLINPEPVVRWNVDKHYLKDLDDAGVSIIPSRFVEPGQDPRRAIEDMQSISDAEQIVVKPAVGVGSLDVQRHDRANGHDMRAHAQRLIDAGRSAILQPYLPSVDDHGETALLFYAGRFSHAIRKGPMLRADAKLQGLFFSENITPRVPTAAELRTAEQAIAAVPFGIPVYARVDLLLDPGGAPRVLELELTEPSQFFAHASGSPQRFAKVLMERCAER
jgi:O-ureido-D-serine cyclo-ligase